MKAKHLASSPLVQYKHETKDVVLDINEVLPGYPLFDIGRIEETQLDDGSYVLVLVAKIRA